MKASNDRRTFKEPDGPAGYPLVGILPHLRKNPLQYFVNVSREFGDIVRLDFGPRRFYLVNHPDYIQLILQDNQAIFEKGYDLVKPVTGNGLIASEGEFWRRQRRIVQPAFHRNKVSALVSIMTDNVRAMTERWAVFSDAGTAVDVEEEMLRLTRHNIVRTMFSLDIDGDLAQTSKDFDACLHYLAQLMKAPFEFMTYVPTPTNLRFRQARRRLDDLVYTILEKRREHPAESDDLLGLLLAARDDATNEAMTDQQLRDEIMTLLITGHETTASALTWTWYLLSKHPGVLAEMQGEMAAVLGEKPPEFEHLQKLKYFGMVIDEVLRLYPSTWLFARKATQRFELGAFQIPKKAMLFLSPFIVHRDERFWHKPTVFRPERFLQDAKEDRHPFAYFPFGGGPRRCLGETVALTVMKLVLVMVLQRYRLEPVQEHEIKPVPRATLRMSDKLRMAIQIKR